LQESAGLSFSACAEYNKQVKSAGVAEGIATLRGRLPMVRREINRASTPHMRA
jgi:hypothetical protein